jgi:hypothetical protein
MTKRASRVKRTGPRLRFAPIGRIVEPRRLQCSESAEAICAKSGRTGEKLSAPAPWRGILRKKFSDASLRIARLLVSSKRNLKGLDPVTEQTTSFESARAERAVPLAAARLGAALGRARVALILISPNPSGAERAGA